MAKRGDMEVLHGPKKLAAQAGLLGSMAGYVLLNHRKLGLRARETPGYLKDLVTLSTGPSDLKYVRFGRKLFVDGYTPPWPSTGFFRALTAAPRFVRGPEEIPCVYVAVAITNRCMYRCEHCYTSHNLATKDHTPIETLLRTIDRILEIGAGVLSLEGGEPLLRFDDLLQILDLARGRTNPYLATTGFSLTREKAATLAQRGLVAAQVSLDHYEPDRHNAFRRSPKAFDAAVEGIRLFREAGVFPIISMVATPELVAEGGLYRFLELAKEVGAGMIQIMDPLPAGNNSPGMETARSLTKEEMQAVFDFHVEANTAPRWRDHPAVSARLYVEGEESLGCAWGGLGIYYISADGEVEPCPCTNISVGNILKEDFDVIYRRMRRLFPKPVGGLCPAYEVGREEARAREAGLTPPLPPEETARIAKRIAERPLPRLLRKIDRS